MTRAVQRRKIATLVTLIGVIGVMSGLVVAAVPLYRLFCQVTGFGGTTRIASTAPQRVLDRVVRIEFDSGVNSALRWRFWPVQRNMDVRVGEEALAFYKARNEDSVPITGTATFNVVPAKAGPYFNKTDCFCFTEQTLQPGETADMAVSFFLDPEMVEDRDLDDVTEITLSYTFFKTDGQKNGPAARSSASAGGGRNAYDLARKQ